MQTNTIEQARAVLGRDVLGPEEIGSVFGTAAITQPLAQIPFSPADLAVASERGMFLVLRTAASADETALTILDLLRRFPGDFDPKLLRQVGYQLRDEWGIALEPLAATETCTAGWALVCKDVLPETLNASYDEQERPIKQFGEMTGHGAFRRRTAVEAVYDTLLYAHTRELRLLERSWDWSSSATVDGGYLNVGGFAASGLQVLSFSRAVRHGQLGVCPTWQPGK